MANEIQDFIRQIPPVTRYMLFASAAAILGTMTGLVSFSLLSFSTGDHDRVIWQIWRPVTSLFLSAGPFMVLAFDLYQFYKHSVSLETSTFLYTADYVFYLVFVCSIIQFFNGLFIGTYFPRAGLNMALTYTWAQENRTATVSFYFLSVKATLTPILIMVMALFQGEVAITVVGYVAAHLYLFLTTLYPLSGGPKLLVTPKSFHQWFPGTSYLRDTSSTVGHVVNLGSRNRDSSSATSSGAASPSPFKGTGRRLGT